MFRFLYNLFFIKFKAKSLDDWYIRIMTRLLNYLLPFFFKSTAWISGNGLIKDDNTVNEKYVVSLTTFPTRINKVYLTIESILRQTTKPDAIILWLYREEFKVKSSLPQNLLKLESRGLQIRFCNENLMPHKKYYYTMLEFPDVNVITIDDDMFYPPSLVSKLIKFHKKYPNAICCQLTRKISIKNSQIEPYKNWKYVTDNTSPGFNYLTMGGGGTLFPPNSLHPEVFNTEILIKKALKADDLWLKVMSLKNKTKVVSFASEYPRLFIPIIQKNNIRLMDSNIGEGKNDIIFKDLIDYYKIPISIFK